MDYRYTDDERAERAPLLPRDDLAQENVHEQFCQMVGVPPSDLPSGVKWTSANRSLYSRAVRQRSAQSMTYRLTASISNILLLSQVVLGAAVTGLGASESSHVIITILGATNTIIAGLVAYLKSRGQPMRARMYRDDLERVVDEIENSEIMWMGISRNVDGYDDIDRDGLVTVRSEVARLTRLYDKAVRTNTLNNPDMYGSGDHTNFLQNSLRSKNLPAASGAAGQAQEAAPSAPSAPAATPAPAADAGGAAAAGGEAQAPAVVPVAADPDESPATAKPTPPGAIKVVAPADDDKDKDKAKDGDDKKDADDEDDDEDAKASNKGSAHKADSDKAGADRKKTESGSPKPASGSKKADASSGDDGASKTSKDVKKRDESDDEEEDGDDDDASSEEEEDHKHPKKSHK